MLSGKQKRYLRSLAVNMKSITQVGKDGLSANLFKSIEDSFNTHELIKINVLKNCMDDPKAMAVVLAERTKSQVVQVIGKKIVLYRQSSKNPVIKL